MLLLEAKAAVTSHCDGYYSTAESGLRRYVSDKKFRYSFVSFRCVASFILSYTYLSLYSD